MIRIGPATLGLSAGAVGFVAAAAAAESVPNPQLLSGLVRVVVLIAVTLGLFMSTYWLLGQRGWLINWEHGRFGGWRALTVFAMVLGWCGIVTLINVRLPIGDRSSELSVMLGEFAVLLAIVAAAENWVARSRRHAPVKAPPN